MKKIVFTGGGTVGHVTLNLLLMPKFIEDGWEVHYIGDKRGIEYQEILKSGLDVTFHSIATGKLRRYFSWQNMLDVFKVGWGIVQSLFIMLRLRPQALFQREALSQYRPLLLRVCQECQSLFTNLTCLWAWPIKSPINLRRRCIQPLSKLPVWLRSSMWEQ